MAADGDPATAALERRVLTRALAARDFAGLHIRFDIAVLDRYRAMESAKLIRTRTVGRISTPRWTLDLGIAPGEREVHVVARDLLDRLPAEEHPHWVEHLVPQPASAHFLQMMIVPGACIDDGDAEPWT